MKTKKVMGTKKKTVDNFLTPQTLIAHNNI